MTTMTAPRSTAPAVRLLDAGRGPGYAAHLTAHGPLPQVRRRDPGLLAQVADSGLTGRGGAGFPTAAKLAAIVGRRRTAVIANGTEGEPASDKDAVLLTHSPHLVLDGLALAARLLGTRTATIAVAQDGPAAAPLQRAIAERPTHEQPRLVAVPDRFVTGEETALVNYLEGGAAQPTGRRPYTRGILVQNVETLAQLALVARHGAGWFRELGTDAEPGTALATVSGAVRSPGVIEFEYGTSLGELLHRCGGLVEPVHSVLIGGYFGRWLRADPELELSSDAVVARGGSLGARVIVALPASACGLAETARVVRYLAGESAGQCGPCVFGLPALAEALEALVGGRATPEALHRVQRLQAQVAGRGACHHPDGTLAFVTSALEVFGHEIDRHRRGLCTATTHAPVLPTPRATPRF